MWGHLKFPYKVQNWTMLSQTKAGITKLSCEDERDNKAWLKFLISMFHHAFFNSIIDKTPTHCSIRVTTHTSYMYCCHNAGADLRDFKFSVLNFKKFLNFK
jgi:hypothetical protein